MTPAEASVNVEVATAEDVKAAIQKALKDAGVTLLALKEQAEAGRFSSENARLAWFAISPFV